MAKTNEVAQGLDPFDEELLEAAIGKLKQARRHLSEAIATLAPRDVRRAVDAAEEAMTHVRGILQRDMC